MRVPVLSFEFFAVLDTRHDSTCKLQSDRDTCRISVGSIDMELGKEYCSTIVEDGSMEIAIDREAHLSLQKIIVAIGRDVEVTQVDFP